jgi:hypothetical protein
MKRPDTARVSRKDLRIFSVLSLIICSAIWQGCSAVPQSTAAPAPTPTPHTGKMVLPTSSVGTSYRQPLLGQTSVESMRVTHGELPPGLTLDPATGVLSGVPTQAGTFTFTILANGMNLQTRGSLTSFVYTLLVSPALTVGVQISPATASVAPGGKVQFSAAVKNTSDTAVAWSASAGTISSTGLWRAPVNTKIKGATITAVSATSPSAYSNATVTLTSGAFSILTGSLPAGSTGSPYSASITGAGGETPYRWSVASGVLPSGLQLNATTGLLSGSPTKAGTYAFSVRGTDNAEQSTEHNYSVLISNHTSVCGPPRYGCSRTDEAVVRVPIPPSVGNLRGANTIVTDPDFGNPIMRLTDANTDPHGPFQNRTFFTASSGSADENLWNLDSTLLVVQDTGARAYPFSFNPSTMQASRMYVSSFPDTNGFTIPDSGSWSRVNPNVLYVTTDTVINKYDFGDRNNAPTPQLVYDFTRSPNCLPPGFSQTWRTRGGVSADDSVMAMGYSNTGAQQTGVYAVAYKAGSGCTVLNTSTGEVWGDWGARGTISRPDRWTIHNVKLSKDGNWLIIAVGDCVSSSCSKGPFFWQIGTTNVISCGDGGLCSGHFTEGYSHWVNNNNSPLSNQVKRTFGDPASAENITHVFPSDMSGYFDQHQSWNNVDPGDSVPFLASTWIPAGTRMNTWYNEIIGVAADGSGTTWRFAHSFITGASHNFSTQYAIGSVSQDGKFFAFSSDWMGTLGSESGSRTCTVGTDCRGDVFVVELK